MSKKLKKNSIKGKSQKAMEQEELLAQKIAEATAFLEADQKMQKQRNHILKVSMICLYTFAIMILSWLIDYLGIVALIAIGFGIVGLRYRKDVPLTWYEKGGLYLGLVGAIIRFVMEMVPIVMYLWK